MPTVVEQLAGLSREVDYKVLPADVVKETKRRILDTLACAVGGLDSKPSKAVRSLVPETHGKFQATVWGGGRTTGIMATLANGTALRYLDFNDVYFGRDPCHASGDIAPAVAMAEMVGASGKELISAVALAYEVHMRLCDFVGEPTIWLRGWDHVTNIPYAAAAACGYLMRMPVDKIAHGMAIAGIQGNTLAELRRGKIPSQKAFAEAKAASDGLMAAQLAEQGMTGSELVLEGDFGHIKVVGGSCDLEALVAPIKTFSVTRTQLKMHAVESMTQAPVQAALTIRNKHKLKPEDIEHIEIGMYDYAFDKPDWDDGKLYPDTRETADHSYPYCIAAALLDGVVGPKQFTDERIKSSDIRGLMDRTSLVRDPEVQGLFPATLPGAVTIKRKDGQVFREVVKYPLGHPQNPMPDDVIEGKFRMLSEGVLSKARADEIIHAVWTLDEIKNTQEFTALLGK